MIQIDPMPLSDPDEELFQQVRNHLLGKTPPPETRPLLVAAITPRPNAGRWLWVIAGVLVGVAAVASAVSRLFFGDSGAAIALLITIITVGSLVGLAIVAGAVVWDPLESTCRHASLSIL